MSSSQHGKMDWTRISLPVDFLPNFKHVILSILDVLLDLPYMDEKLEIFNFQPNLNHSKILYVASYMVKFIMFALINPNPTRIFCSSWIPNAIKICNFRSNDSSWYALSSHLLEIVLQIFYLVLLIIKQVK